MRGGVFVNYRGADSTGYGALLHAELSREFGAEWVFLDSSSIPPGADYVEQLLGRVRTAGVVLAVIGARWLTVAGLDGRRRIDDPTDWIRRELMAAFAAGVRVVPLLTDDAELPGAEALPADLAPLARCQYRRLRQRDATADLARLVGELADLDPALARRRGRFAGPAGPREESAAVALPPVWNLPARNPDFTGRELELAAIRAGLAAGTTVTVQALRGMAGVGKTQTAIEFAYRQAGEYDVVWWLNADQPTLLPGQLADLGAELGLPPMPDGPAAIRAVHRELLRRDRWLLIFDNAEDVANVRLSVPAGSGHVLLTTRRAGFRALGPVLALDVLDRPEAITLLRRRAPQVDAADADSLADLLGDLPLALDQAAAYLDRTETPAQDYQMLLRTRAVELYARGQPSRHEHTIGTIWQASLDRLRTASPAAVQLLQLCAQGAPEPVPLTLFTQHPDRLPRPLAAAAADPLAMSEVVGVLTDYSLARRTPNGLLLHRLLHAVVRQAAPLGRHDPRTTMLRLLRAELPDGIWDEQATWSRWHPLIPHVIAATAATAVGTTAAAGDLGWLLDGAGVYQYMFGAMASGQELLQRALDLREALHGPDHVDVATTLTGLGEVIADGLARHAAARPLLERALRIYQAAAPEHPRVVTATACLAITLLNLNQPRLALQLAEKALRLAESIHHPHHPGVAAALNAEGLALLDLNRPDVAQPILERALRIRVEAFGENHPWTAAPMVNLARALPNDPHTARRLLERAVRIRHDAYGPDSLGTAIALTGLGTFLITAGEPDAARPLLEKALAAKTRYLGAEHPWTIATRRHLNRALARPPSSARTPPTRYLSEPTVEA